MRISMVLRQDAADCDTIILCKYSTKKLTVTQLRVYRQERIRGRSVQPIELSEPIKSGACAAKTFLIRKVFAGRIRRRSWLWLNAHLFSSETSRMKRGWM